MLGLQNDREWALFCNCVLEQPHLLEDERFSSNAQRSTHRQALRQIIVEAFARLGTAEVIARLDAAPIANAKVNDMQGVWRHPQLQARQRWVQVGSPNGNLPALLPPAANSAFTPRMDPIPSLGEHNETILTELGYSDGDIDELKAGGAI
jgi:itaconate CoA-transferase